jgi:hypothetical protein
MADSVKYSRNKPDHSKTSLISPTNGSYFSTLPDIDDVKHIELKDINELKRKENFHAVKKSKWDQIDSLDHMIRS